MPNPPASLLTPGELAELLRDRQPVLLDIRWSLGGPPGLPEYEAGHIPGAKYVDLQGVLSAPPRPAGGNGGDPRGPGGRHPLPDTATFQHGMREGGVSDGSTVVVYDAGDGMAAARCWWCLRYFGHHDVRVLDGGYRAWLAGDHPISTATPAHARGTFVARPGGVTILDAEDAARLARTGVLLDARAGERYRGEVEPVDPVGGHIPGAVSAPATGSVDGSGRYLHPELLRSRFRHLGIDGTTSVGCYCGSGVSAAQQVLALALAGVDAGLYVGSWSDWVRDAGRPVATGAEPG